jgi:hypothetical protein
MILLFLQIFEPKLAAPVINGWMSDRVEGATTPIIRKMVTG